MKKQINTKVYLTVIIFIVALVPSMIAAILYYQSEHNSIARQAANYEEEISKDMVNNFVEMQEQLDKIQYEITSHFVAQGMEKIDTGNLKEGEVEKIHILENLLQSIRRTTSGINNIYVISKQNPQAVYGSTYTFNKRWLLETEWLQPPYTSSRNWVFIPEHKINYLNSTVKGESLERCFSFLIGLVNKDGDSEFEYVLQIDIDAELIYSFINNIRVNDGDAVCVYDEHGKMIQEYNVNDQTQKVFRTIKESEKKQQSSKEDIRKLQKYVLSKTTIPEIGLKVYKLSTPFDNINNQTLVVQIVMLVLAAIVIAILAATKISSFFINPFEQLIQQTLVSIDDTAELQQVSIDSNSSDIYIIKEHFNMLIERINQLIKSTVAHEAEKRELQMKMLQAQISPHFLYNTLNSIKWMALLKQQPEIANTITDLVDLLEYCYKDTKDLVAIKDEIEFLKDYIEIQKMRNLDCKVQVQWFVDEEVEDFKIIKFSLQPSVENAFIHAFPENQEGAMVTVKAFLKGDSLILQVEDNGVGFDEAACHKNMTGIGIENTDNRIKMTFGEEYGQNIISSIGNGTVVTIKLPVIKES